MNENDKYLKDVTQLSEEWRKGDEKGRGYILLASSIHIVGKGKDVHYSEGDASYIRLDGDKLNLTLALEQELEEHPDLARIVLGAVHVAMQHAKATTIEELLQVIVNTNAKENDGI